MNGCLIGRRGWACDFWNRRESELLMRDFDCGGFWSLFDDQKEALLLGCWKK